MTLTDTIGEIGVLRYFIRIPNKLYRNDNFSPTEVVVWGFVQMVVVPMSFAGVVYVTPELISYYMYGNEYTRKELVVVRGAIKSLAEKGMIVCGDGECEIQADDFILEGKDFFSQVPASGLQKILQSKNKNRMSICYYLIWLLGTRNSSTKVGNQSIEYLADHTGLSKSTIERYNKILEELGILYIARNECAKFDNGDFIHRKNYYGLAENESAINSMAGTTKESANAKRSMAAKYNYIINNPNEALAKYGEGAIQEVYDYYAGTDKSLDVLENILLFT